jgi:hypothetical protein
MALASSLSTTVADTVVGRWIRPLAVSHQSVPSGVTDSAPKALRFLQARVGLIAAVAIVALVLLVVAVAATRLKMRRELAARVSFAVIPTESFDPSPEEILRFAAGLSRTRRVVRRLGAGRTDAIRLRLLAVAGGQVVQLLEGPRRSLSILRNAGFDQVDLRPPESLPGLHPAGPDLLSRPSSTSRSAGCSSSSSSTSSPPSPGPSVTGRRLALRRRSPKES